jgi:hypothetical protein
MSELIEFENRCGSCEHWKRSIISDFPKEDVKGNVGTCSLLDNNFAYWFSEEEAQKLTKPGMISCGNLFTHEFFGCIHYSKI